MRKNCEDRDLELEAREKISRKERLEEEEEEERREEEMWHKDYRDTDDDGGDEDDSEDQMVPCVIEEPTPLPQTYANSAS